MDEPTREGDGTRGEGIAGAREWMTLIVAVVSVLMVVLDTTILNVAVPSIQRNLELSLSEVQWVITGYSLTFASFLVIGGRLGDLYGHRRTLIVGMVAFGIGSALASLATTLAVLILGEAVLEGVGAALMVPATLAILAQNFSGRKRTTSFAAYGAANGVAIALGPVLGGVLTTNLSWRWSFRLNMIIMPLAVLGALAFVPRGVAVRNRPRLDWAGASLVALGTFLLVAAVNEGGRFGWLQAVKPVVISGRMLWATARVVSAGAVLGAVSVVVLTTFVVLERVRERRGRGTLFEFSQFRHKSLRFGVCIAETQAMGHYGLLFVLPVYLQEARGLTPQTNGLWQLPAGICVVLGSAVGGRLAARYSPIWAVRSGLGLEVLGVLVVAITASPSQSFAQLLPGLMFFGIGVGFAGSQLNNVALSGIADDKAGVAGGVLGTGRQLGSALGVAVVGSLVASLTLRFGANQDVVTKLSGNYSIDRTGLPGVSNALVESTRQAVAAAARTSLLVVAGLITVSTILAFFVPRQAQSIRGGTGLSR